MSFRLLVVPISQAIIRPTQYQKPCKKPYKNWLKCNRDILPKDNNTVITCHGCSHSHHCCYWHNHHIVDSLCNSITMLSVSTAKNSIIIYLYLLCSCCKGFFRSSASLSRFVIGTYIYLWIEFIMCVPTSVYRPKLRQSTARIVRGGL